MPVNLISVVAAFGVLGSSAVALTVTPSDYGISVHDRAYPTKADFDWIFAQFVTAFDLESVAREKIRMAGLKRVNLGKFGGE
jgi:hypothetical protein